MNKQEIDAKYLEIHDKLTAQWQAGELPDVEFKRLHDKNWRTHRAILLAKGLGQPEPEPDPTEIDKIKKRLKALEDAQ